MNQKRTKSFFRFCQNYPNIQELAQDTEQLKGLPEGRWSRRLSKKHRLIYRIYETEVVVLVISAYGHYDDK